MKQNLRASTIVIFLSLLPASLVGCNRGGGESGTSGTTGKTEQPVATATPPAAETAPASPPGASETPLSAPSGGTSK